MLVPERRVEALLVVLEVVPETMLEVAEERLEASEDRLEDAAEPLAP